MSMHITLKQLEAFASVAKTLSLTHAAKILNMSQPAVSSQMSNLEEQLGIKLFEYVGKRLTLTDAGRDIAKKVLILQDKVEIFKQSASHIKGALTGNLSISIPAIAVKQSFYLLNHFHRQYPGITLDIKVSDGKSQLQLLHDHLIDLCIMDMPPHKISLVSETLFNYHLVIIAPPHHPLTKKTNITLAELSQETFIIGEHHANRRTILEEKIITHDTRLISVNNAHSIIDAVEAGLGLAVSADCLLEKDLYDKSYTILSVMGFPIPSTIQLVYPHKKTLSPATLEFIKIAHEFREHPMGC